MKNPGGHGLKDYHINIFHSEEDGGYIADIPDLEPCSAFGDTPEQAPAEVEVAKGAWLEAARNSGKAIPTLRYRPVIYQTFP
jgi:predicted RNase H-like HicB family nuclease